MHLLRSNETAGLMPLPSLPHPFTALGLYTCCSSHLQCPSHLFLPDKIHHSYLVYPSSSASSSVRHFLVLLGHCFSYNLPCIRELHPNSHCGTSLAGLCSLLIEQFLPPQQETWTGDTHLGLDHFSLYYS